MIVLTWIHAIATPKSCQDRKVAAIRDACGRRGLRVAWFKERGIAMPGLEILFKGVLTVGLASCGRKAGGKWENCDASPKAGR